MQTHDPTKNRFAYDLPLLIFLYDAWSDLDTHAERKDTSEDGPARDAAFELVDFGTGLVDVEGADDDETGRGGEVAYRDRDLFDDVFVHSVDVVFELSRDGDDGGGLGDGACVVCRFANRIRMKFQSAEMTRVPRDECERHTLDKLHNTLLMCERLLLFDQVNLIL